MITLHGIYENGIIKINEKKLPKIIAKVNIQILEENNEQIKNRKIPFGQYNLKGQYDNKNIRNIAYE